MGKYRGASIHQIVLYIIMQSNVEELNKCYKAGRRKKKIYLENQGKPEMGTWMRFPPAWCGHRNRTDNVQCPWKNDGKSWVPQKIVCEWQEFQIRLWGKSWVIYNDNVWLFTYKMDSKVLKQEIIIRIMLQKYHSGAQRWIEWDTGKGMYLRDYWNNLNEK